MARKPSSEAAAPAAPSDTTLPVVELAVLGQTRDFRHAAAWLAVQGQRVVGAELLAVSPDLDGPEHAFQEAIYQRVWLKQQPTAAEKLETARECAPYKGTDVDHARGFAVARRNGTWGLLEVHTEGDKVVRADCVSVAEDFTEAFGLLLDRRDRMLRRDRRKS